MPIRLRVLWVTPNLPLRGVTAARERWWSLLARLALRHDVELLAFVDPEDASVEGGLPPGLAAVHRVSKQPWRPDDPLALVPRGVRGGFSHPDLRRAVAERLASGRFDLVQYEYTEMANVMAPAPLPRVLTAHQLGFAQEGPRWRAEGGGVRRGALAFFRHLRDLDWELRALRSVNHVITMSPEDAARVHRFLPELPVSVSPLGVDCGYFRPPEPAPAPAVDLLFVANFVHPPNADAVRFLVHEVLPRLGRAARLRVVGHNVPPEIAGLAQAGAVEITGPVPDLRPHLAGAAVVVAPVRFGTGMRGKVLEALAMARPLVTTSVGAEGLGAISGQHLLVADGARAFAGAVRRVLDDAGFAERLGAAGRALVEARFDWDAIAAAHENIYAGVLREARPVPPLPRERAPLLRATLGRLGWAPAVATGAALIALSGLRWHLRARARRRAVPAPTDPSAMRRRAAA